MLPAKSEIQLDIFSGNIVSNFLLVLFIGKYFFTVEKNKDVKYFLYLISQDFWGVLRLSE
jgi:hypothetical protein